MAEKKMSDLEVKTVHLNVFGVPDRSKVKHMTTVRDLIIKLAEYPLDAFVVMSSDAEGNNHGPLADAQVGYYVPHGSNYGEFWYIDEDDEDDDDEAPVRYVAVCLNPI